MANTVKIKHSSVSTAIPATLEQGELAINTADALLFWEDSVGVVNSTYLSPTPADIGAAPAASPAFTGTITVSAGSKVGIGLAGPQAPLHVFASGTSAIFGTGSSAFQFYATTGGPAKIVTIGSPTTFQIGSGSLIATEILYGNSVVARYTNTQSTFPSGSLSAGTLTPGIAFQPDPDTGIGSVIGNTLSVATGGVERARFKTSGSLRLIPLSTAPSSPEAGEIYFDSGLSKLRVYTGTAWANLH